MDVELDVEQQTVSNTVLHLLPAIWCCVEASSPTCL